MLRELLADTQDAPLRLSLGEEHEKLTNFVKEEESRLKECKQKGANIGEVKANLLEDPKMLKALDSSAEVIQEGNTACRKHARRLQDLMELQHGTSQNIAHERDRVYRVVFRTGGG